NALFKTDFDETIDTINIIPQEIGRVLLHLFTNAFYAVNEKKNLLQPVAENYEQMASISTKKINHQIEIIVSDNGIGDSLPIIDKKYYNHFLPPNQLALV